MSQSISRPEARQNWQQKLQVVCVCVCVVDRMIVDANAHNGWKSEMKV